MSFVSEMPPWIMCSCILETTAVVRTLAIAATQNGNFNFILFSIKIVMTIVTFSEVHVRYNDFG
ncbi:hypothetical protein HII30_15495 [Paenibacillus lemnae]|uniref:Uncharacterized protein n=1 Tax=Paenibacillus lemnae TaxID=1330551 RepID=A0A848M819_PAELE|nr:hypothetical protein [Paenibacillus lemnae]